MIKVLVNGALGRMGSEVVKTVLEQEDMELVAAVDAFGADKMIPVKNGNQMAVATDLKAKLMVVKQASARLIWQSWMSWLKLIIQVF